MFNKIKNKKTLIAIVVTAFIVVIGGTFALFFSNTSISNLFNLGNFNIVMNETITSPDNWMPGEQIAKTITATNNGNIQAAFRVKITESWKDASNNDITVPSGTVTIDFINKHDWVYNADDGYYYYKWIIEPGATTSSIISGVTLNADIMGNSSCQNTNGNLVCTSNLNGLAGATYTVTFQKETVDYSKYQQYWDTEQSIVAYQYLYTLPEGRNVENLQVGDEVCINGDTTECFNFYGYDGNNVKLLSKWNLNVGNNPKGTATNLQDSDVKGSVSSGTKYGNVEFSATNYWYDGSSLKSKYGSEWNTNNVYDTDYVTEPDFSGNGFNTTGYSIAYYVEEYKDKLEDYGATINDARLLTYAEATDSSIGCSGSGCPTNGFITNTSFWLGSAYGDNYLWFVRCVGSFSGVRYDFEDFFGVRPVIAVSKSDINSNVDDANKFKLISLPNGRTRDNLQVGDEICINGDTAECFNFYGYDGNNVKLLSKYNLKVGKIYDSRGTTQTGTYSSSDTGYGLQSSEARGYVSGQTRYGTVAFSQTNYWYDGSNLKSKYGSSYPADVYDIDYVTEPDFSTTCNYSTNCFNTSGYSIAYYVEEYKKVLEDYGVTISEARLLTYVEATSSSIGCSGSSCPNNGFIRNTSFWLGSAYGYIYLWYVYSDGGFGNNVYGSVYAFGVRPVIVISKSDI